MNCTYNQLFFLTLGKLNTITIVFEKYKMIANKYSMDHMFNN